MENESHKDDKVVEEVKIVHDTETTFVQGSKRPCTCSR